MRPYHSLGQLQPSSPQPLQVAPPCGSQKSWLAGFCHLKLETRRYDLLPVHQHLRSVAEPDSPSFELQTLSMIAMISAFNHRLQLVTDAACCTLLVFTLAFMALALMEMELLALATCASCTSSSVNFARGLSSRRFLKSAGASHKSLKVGLCTIQNMQTRMKMSAAQST